MSKIGLDDLLLFGSIRPLGRRKKKRWVLYLFYVLEQPCILLSIEPYVSVCVGDRRIRSTQIAQGEGCK